MERLRTAEVQRKTNETEVLVQLNLDGTGSHQIDIEIPFLGHMLVLLSLHSLCDLKVTARGDVEVDDHHTVEDIGICLGQALAEALGEKRGIRRYGEATIPMDEALSRVVVDLSGRAVLVYNVEVERACIGNFATENVREFLKAIANGARMAIHVDALRGDNTHHILESIFKAFARALKEAIDMEPRMEGIWSSKGRL